MSVASSQSSKARAGLKPAVPRASRRAILHLCPDLEPGDPARETVDMAVLTQRTGGRALIASSGGMLVTEVERAAVRHTRMPLQGRGVFVTWRNRVHLTALLQRERPSVIHAHGVDVLPLAIATSRAHRLPLVADLTDPLINNARMRRLMAQLATHPSLVVRVPSQYIMRQLFEFFRFPGERIRHVPPGADMQWQGINSIGAERLQGLSRLWRVPEPASVVLVPMPLEAGLGHDIFLEAMTRLRDENIFGVMIGSDRKAPGRRDELESEVNRLELNGKVVMPEFCTDWPTAFWLAGVVVAPNITPCGQNRELLSAQAIGRPVIVTESGANSEMVRSGETAWIVPPGDAASLAAAVREAVHLNANERLGLADRTRGFIAENFPLDAWFAGMMDIYEGLLQPDARETRAAA